MTNDEPVWIVNDLGELGVFVNGRYFFLYKGDNIEYSGLYDDGSPMLYRRVGKREFGETCWPLQWIMRGHCDHRYTVELVGYPGLSNEREPIDDWRPLPQLQEDLAASKPEPPAKSPR